MSEKEGEVGGLRHRGSFWVTEIEARKKQEV